MAKAVALCQSMKAKINLDVQITSKLMIPRSLLLLMLSRVRLPLQRLNSLSVMSDTKHWLAPEPQGSKPAVGVDVLLYLTMCLVGPLQLYGVS